MGRVQPWGALLGREMDGEDEGQALNAFLPSCIRSRRPIDVSKENDQKP